MLSSLSDSARLVLVGIAATALMDAWLWLAARLGMPGTSIGLIGRWVGHFAQGRFAHAAIAKAAPVRHELALGWTVHYLTGIAFAVLPLGLAGPGWLAEPTYAVALAAGLLTLAAPWLVMQPAMGAGFAASRTPSPHTNRARSLANHAVFGSGLYLAAAALAQFAG